MPQAFESDELLVRYHLGELSPEERDAVEDRFFVDDEFHEQVLAAEEELIDSYLRNELSAEQAKHFEDWFLPVDDRREKLEFARALARSKPLNAPPPRVTGASLVQQYLYKHSLGIPDYRLGDVIDDFCVRCKRVMNHSVVSLANGNPAKVRCRTCHSDHDYRHKQPPPPKTDATKRALFDEVLKKVNPDDSGAHPPEPLSRKPPAKKP